MSRPPAPWKWEARKGWYAWVKGSRVRLASFKEGKTVALRRLHELIGAAELIPAEVPLVGDLVVGYLEGLVARRDRGEVESQTKADAVRRLAGFADAHGDKPADALRPVHVEEWLTGKTAWGATMRHDGAGAVRSVFRWALRQGLIDRDPLAALEKPRRKAKRETIPGGEEVARAFAAILTPELRDLLVFIHGTGCRPKEARTLEARQLDRASGVVVLAEHKTARKTGKKRVIYLTGAAAEVAFRLADAHPEGPIFLNSRGRPWTHNAVGLAVRRLRERAGLGEELVAYCLRHLFATDALAGGASPALVAQLMGHADLRMLGRYSHLSDKHDELRETIAKVRGETKAGGPEPPS